MFKSKEIVKRIILLSLNELNIDYIGYYISKGILPNFKFIIEKYGYQKTYSEKEYHLLEPWIQWVSIHTGKSYNEHQVFRLGDIEHANGLQQLWEIIEQRGYSVGAIAPLNAANNTKTSGFFVPDPWTQTKASGEPALKKLAVAISSAVNNNASNKLTAQTFIHLLRGMTKYVKPLEYKKYVSLLINIKKRASKVLILDNLLSDVFIDCFQNKKPDFSSLFLNGGAHIQHHYMFNSGAYSGLQKNPDWYCPENEDPLLDALVSYDKIIERLLKLDARLIIATGLHQEPHSAKTFYWRLKDHDNFLKLIGIENFKNVIPRMSRDFLIECGSENVAKNIQSQLERIVSAADELKIFEVDNRGKSLFIELIYPNEINKGFQIKKENDLTMPLDFYDFVAFVAIKNGKHNGTGYLIDTGEEFKDGKGEIPLPAIFDHILSNYQ